MESPFCDMKYEDENDNNELSRIHDDEINRFHATFTHFDKRLERYTRYGL